LFVLKWVWEGLKSLKGFESLEGLKGFEGFKIEHTKALAH